MILLCLCDGTNFGQTRIDQISQIMTFGVLELEDSEDLFATSESHHWKASDHQLSREELEQLELEKREIIGEILKLNPAFKPPTDYKPLLREAKVAIPIKEHPGYNFIGLVFGPLSDTQKRLEKETGTKIQVYGTKSDTGGQVEITPDGKEIDNAYEDMYVNIAADTYEKVDAAVALIELLITSVLMNPVSSSTTSTVAPDDNVNTNRSQSTPSSTMAPALTNQETPQPFPGSLPLPQGQFPQYPQTWFPVGPTQNPTYRQSGFVNPSNASAAFLNNTGQVSSSPLHHTNMPSLFGPRPVIPASFSPVPQNPSAGSGPQPSYMQQPPPHAQTGGPQQPYMHKAPLSTGWPGPPHNLPLTSKPPFSASESARWLPSPVSTSASQGPANIMQGPPVNHPNDMISPLSAGAQSSGPVANQQSRGFSPMLPSAAPESTPSSMGPLQPAIPHMGMHPPPSNAVPGSAPMPFPMQSSGSLPQPGMHNSFPGNAPNFDSIRPVPGAIPRPQQPSSGDFTFQPHRPPNAASQVWLTNQAAPQNIRHPVQSGQASLPPHSPHMRPMMHNMNPSPMHGFPRPPASHQMNQPRPQIPTNFAGNSTSSLPPRHQMMPGHNAGVPNMPLRNFAPHPINNSLGPFPPRPGSQMHGQENHLARPPRFPTPHQHFGNHPGRPFPGHQVYDPFAPTGAPFNSQMGGNAARMPSESDPEYEDLMASVGVK
ncbi:leucine-rich repeat extensin-like protein 5 isoform X2 [Salvia miltiorrhiza]|uniref:leucine-rich repeat extensin-like protein 5 isoform X2 n=1 Tax=Salvia miltiorrhiza TaxID=226208 RepID=UPI0025ABC261|nr:leucine-rich repeat extensin-like protein 5 isoform X2 [Salvia miltiorrhiza]